MELSKIKPGTLLALGVLGGVLVGALGGYLGGVAVERERVRASRALGR